MSGLGTFADSATLFVASLFILACAAAIHYSVIKPLRELGAWVAAQGGSAAFKRGGDVAELRKSLSELMRSLEADRKSLYKARDSLQQAYDRLLVAHFLTQKAQTLVDQNQFWPLLSERLTRYFGCERVSVFQRYKDHLVSRYAHGLQKPVSVKVGEGIAGWVAETGMHYLTNDPYHDSKFAPEVDRLTSYKTENLLAYPLTYQDKNVGAVELVNKPGGFRAEDLEAMEYLGSQIAVFFAKFKMEEHQEELTRQMVQMEKMAAVGRLAAGIAHEINNPLSVITGYTQLLMRRTTDAPEVMSDLQHIRSETQRIGSIVHNLLGFSRSARFAFSTVSLPKLVEESLSLVDYELRKRRVEIARELDASAPPVLADSNQLKQVLVNLVVNALHAMDAQGSGKIVLRLTQRPEKSRVILEVEDNGPGIPPEIQDKIFEPFFTTKEPGKGTGLGLYVVMGIIERHKGAIELDSKPGRTVFRITLPVPHEQHAASPEEAA